VRRRPFQLRLYVNLPLNQRYEASSKGVLSRCGEPILEASIRQLEQTLSEEEKTDKSLTALAEGVVNQEAYADAGE